MWSRYDSGQNRGMETREALDYVGKSKVKTVAETYSLNEIKRRTSALSRQSALSRRDHELKSHPIVIAHLVAAPTLKPHLSRWGIQFNPGD
jgi:hypothetical protein